MKILQSRKNYKKYSIEEINYIKNKLNQNISLSKITSDNEKTMSLVQRRMGIG